VKVGDVWPEAPPAAALASAKAAINGMDRMLMILQGLTADQASSVD
jgi:hypothetical protein